MGKRYENQHDVSLRLHNTILKYKETYYYALLLDRPPLREEDGEIVDDTTIGLHSLTEHKLKHKVDANDPDLEITSPALGYCEGREWKQALFLARAPFRRQKQGIGSDNVVYYTTYDKVGRTPDVSIFALPGFEAMLKNKYIHYQDIISSIVKTAGKYDHISRPFSRNFCVVYNKKDGKTIIQHNLVDIGEVNLSDTLVQLYPEHNHSVFSMKLADLGVTVA